MELSLIGSIQVISFILVYIASMYYAFFLVSVVYYIKSGKVSDRLKKITIVISAALGTIITFLIWNKLNMLE